jgi:copper chaperone CopZ
MTDQTARPILLPLLGAVLLLSPGCFRPDIRTHEVQVPELKREACAQIIEEALKQIDGVETINLDVAQHLVTVRFEGIKLGTKNIEYVIASAGFEANGVPAKPEAQAKLPASCQPES